MTNKTYDTSTSKQLFSQAKMSLAGGVASSMHKSEWEEYPIFMERGSGSHLYDVDENEYIDFSLKKCGNQFLKSKLSLNRIRVF